MKPLKIREKTPFSTNLLVHISPSTYMPSVSLSTSEYIPIKICYLVDRSAMTKNCKKKVSFNRLNI